MSSSQAVMLPEHVIAAHMSAWIVGISAPEPQFRIHVNGRGEARAYSRCRALCLVCRNQQILQPHSHVSD